MSNSLTLLFSLTASLHTSEPESTFRFARLLDMNYQVTFVDGIRKKSQIIEFRNGRDITRESVKIQDLNGDGYADLSITGGVGADGQPWTKAWIFDNKKRLFIFDQVTKAGGSR